MCKAKVKATFSLGLLELEHLLRDDMASGDEPVEVDSARQA